MATKQEKEFLGGLDRTLMAPFRVAAGAMQMGAATLRWRFLGASSEDTVHRLLDGAAQMQRGAADGFVWGPIKSFTAMTDLFMPKAEEKQTPKNAPQNLQP